MKIADRGVKSKSNRLKGRRIALAVCGGIGAVETVKVIRELRRHGASVRAFVTSSALSFIGELSLEWASGEKVVTQVGAEVDHLETYDAVVVVPATWNTIAKAANGISDNPVTLLVAGQLGARSPLLIVPTMNEQLTRHPLYPIYKERLISWGCSFLEPAIEEGRFKVPAPELIARKAMEIL